MKNKKIIALFYISIVLIALLIILLKTEIEIPNILKAICFFAGLAAFPVGIISFDMINENKINKDKIKKTNFFDITKKEIFDDYELKKMFRGLKIFSPPLIFLLSLFIYCGFPIALKYISDGTLENYQIDFETFNMQLLKWILVLLCIFSIYYYLKITKKIDRNIKEIISKKIHSDFNLISMNPDTIDIERNVKRYCDEMQLSDCGYNVLDAFKFVDDDRLLIHLKIEKHIHTKRNYLMPIFEGLVLIIPTNYSVSDFFYQTDNLEVMTNNNRINYTDNRLVESIATFKEKYQKDIRMFSCDNNTIYISCRQPSFSSDNDTKKKLQYKIVDYYYGIKCMIEVSKLIDNL